MTHPERKMINGHRCDEWASSISANIADMITDHDWEDRQNLGMALYIALKQCPDAVEMLIGTPLIEEAWFENWERMEREEKENE